MYKLPGEMVYTGMEQYKVVDKMIDFLTAWANRHDGECEWTYRKQHCHSYRRWLEGRLGEMEKALPIVYDALRAPLDDWKGVLERKALDALRALLPPKGAGE